MGVTEPTAEEKDPTFLALQVKSLVVGFESFVATYKENLESIHKAFSMVDAHQQVMARIARDVSTALINLRTLQASGDVDPNPTDFGRLKVYQDGTLNMSAYYEEYRLVASQAGQHAADLAVVLWSQGRSVEEAVTLAKEKRGQSEQASPAEPVDYEYAEEHFGGNYGKGNSHEAAHNGG